MVYFIQQGNDGPIKIGHTGQIHRRLPELQTANAHKLRLVGCVEGDVAEEKYIQNIFKTDRLHGEWFRPSQELRMFIKEAPLLSNFTRDIPGPDIFYEYSKFEKMRKSTIRKRRQ